MSTNEDGTLTEGTGETIDWEAGKCKEFRWTFENTGSKKALFRARPEAAFTGTGEPEKEATAWGEGTPFNEGQGNWAMYFDFEGTEKEVNLRAKRLLDTAHDIFDAGTVNVRQDSEKIYIEIKTTDGWKMIDSHVHLAEKPDYFPTSGGQGGGNQNPNTGHFDYRKPYLTEVTGYHIYEINLPNYSPVLIAVHACLTQGEASVQEGAVDWELSSDSTPWEKGEDSEGDYWFYYCQPVESDGKVTLKLEGYLSENAGNGSCTVELQAEAVQATHGAASAEWGPGNPCAR
ncbi:MAG: hypothetical protein GX318_06405 [Clostridia bacterium]|nr:hypothetical protein [Clostridia bacterium]